MADYEAAPEGGIKEAGAEQPVTAPAAEEVKETAEVAPEAEAEKTEESTDTEKSEEAEASPAAEEKTED